MLIIARKILSHAVYFADEQAQCLVNVPTNDFDGFVEIKGQTIESNLDPRRPHLVGIALLFCYARTIVLRLVTYLLSFLRRL